MIAFLSKPEIRHTLEHLRHYAIYMYIRTRCRDLNELVERDVAEEAMLAATACMQASGQLARDSPAIASRATSPRPATPPPTRAPHTLHHAVAARRAIAKLRGALWAPRELPGDRGRLARSCDAPMLSRRPAHNCRVHRSETP